MEKLIKLLAEYEQRYSESQTVWLQLFSDGSGHAETEKNDRLFEFNNLEELRAELAK